MIRSLLVAVDSSAHARAALQHASAVARAYEAQVTGMYVLDIRYLEMPPYLDYSSTIERVPSTHTSLDVLERYRVKSERILNDVREAMDRQGIPVGTLTEEGVPSQVISERGAGHDLIIMGKRGEHAKWGRDLLGSSAESVVRTTGTPILLVEDDFSPLSKALLLFDGSHAAARAMKLAADMATKMGFGLTVLTADDDVEEAETIQKEARTYLDLYEIPVHYRVAPGRAPKAATALLEEERVDLLIMGTRGHSALHDLILGSTAEQLMRSVRLPVLLVP